MTASQGAAQTDLRSAINKYAGVLMLMHQRYIDTVNVEQLVEQAIINSLHTLDPHSYYISRKEMKEAHEPLEGNFEGIGIEFNIMRDTLIVVAPLPGGPSEKVGLQSRDRIVKVDGKDICNTGLTIRKVHSLLRGTKGSMVDITVLRGNDNLLEFSIIRDKIPVNSVTAAYEVKPGMVYIRLSAFGKTSMDELQATFAKYPGPKSLILDLRDNSGGFLPVAIELADQFLDSDKLIVYTEGLHTPPMSATATAKGYFEKGALAVLINEGSASASEIVSGAVQDWDRGIIIGRRSFGKGLVQSEFPLNDGSAVRLTIARYHTPSGRVIQSPYKKGESEEYYKNYYRRLDNELFNADSVKFADSLKFTTLMNGRTVYGGGGIMPDIYVPIDTSDYTKYSGALVRKNVFQLFVSSYIDRNKAMLERQYPKLEKFKKSFTVDAALLDDFVKFAEQEGVPADSEGLSVSENYIKRYIKLMIARNLYSFAAYIELFNDDDPVFRKAVETLDNKKAYSEALQ
jgi:carboxyl-terminal processing protease